MVILLLATVGQDENWAPSLDAEELGPKSRLSAPERATRLN
jgi:hypothetical protein